MKFRLFAGVVTLSTATAAPLARDSLGNAQASIDLLLRHLKSDREIAETAFRTLQTKVLNYQQSVEGYEAWRGYAHEQEKAVEAAEKVKGFLMKMDGIHGLRPETPFQTPFQFQGTLI